jgi:short subunit dehydrogenase-like uncharacterized protein
MAASTPTRDFDIVLFGATGFTGELTAQYLARNAPEDLRWALVGRSPGKLEAVRSRLADIDSSLAELPLLVADAADPASLAAVAERTRVVITTVGPFLEYGGPLVAACAAAGTDYVDITGEPDFVDHMYVEHHATAVASGARIVHACGFDSVPHDLGAYFTIQHLRPTGPVEMRGVVRSNGAPSGGTFATAMDSMARMRQMQSAFRARLKAQTAQGPTPGRSSRAVGGRPGRDSVLGLYLLPLPTIDPQVVARSGAALASYGPQFRYSHFAGVKTLKMTVAGIAGLTGLFAAAQVPPLRRAIKARLPQGTGPSEGRRAHSWFTVDFVATSGGRTVHTKVKGGDPGYDETAKMLAESALCLAYDDNPPTAGSVTTAVAMGDRLLERLQKAGITFEVVA